MSCYYGGGEVTGISGLHAVEEKINSVQWVNFSGSRHIEVAKNLMFVIQVTIKWETNRFEIKGSVGATTIDIGHNRNIKTQIGKISTKSFSISQSDPASYKILSP